MTMMLSHVVDNGEVISLFIAVQRSVSHETLFDFSDPRVIENTPFCLECRRKSSNEASEYV